MKTSLCLVKCCLVASVDVINNAVWPQPGVRFSKEPGRRDDVISPQSCSDDLWSLSPALYRAVQFCLFHGGRTGSWCHGLCLAAAAACCAALCTRQGTVFFLSPTRLAMHCKYCFSVWYAAGMGLCSFFVSVIAKTCITGNHIETGSEDGKARLR